MKRSLIRNPTLRGLEWDGDDDLKLLSNLEYAIMNRERLAYIYDFNK